MEEKEIIAVLNDITRQIAEIKRNGVGCPYHKELEEKLQKTIADTQAIRIERTEANKRLGDILDRIEKRLDSGDRNFDKIQSDIQEIKEDIVEIKTKGKLSADWLARGISVIVMIIMALQLLHAIVKS